MWIDKNDKIFKINSQKISSYFTNTVVVVVVFALHVPLVTWVFHKAISLCAQFKSFSFLFVEFFFSTIAFLVHFIAHMLRDIRLFYRGKFHWYSSFLSLQLSNDALFDIYFLSLVRKERANVKNWRIYFKIIYDKINCICFTFSSQFKRIHAVHVKSVLLTVYHFVSVTHLWNRCFMWPSNWTTIEFIRIIQIVLWRLLWP